MPALPTGRPVAFLAYTAVLSVRSYTTMAVKSDSHNVHGGYVTPKGVSLSKNPCKLETTDTAPLSVTQSLLK